MNRRNFLELSMHAGGAAVTVGLVGLAGVTLFSPNLLDEKGEVWARVGPLDRFPLNATKAAFIEIPRDDWARSLRTQLLYVRRNKGGEVEAFSRKCTDLSCPVTWDSGSETFLCPCHGGIFNRNGEPMAGPPNRPLYRYRHRIEDGFLEVDLHSIPPFG